jgi:hypothetical protein
MTAGFADGAALARAAEALVGARFQLQGRDPGLGLDCVGVLAASLAAIGRQAPLPRAYSLRTLPRQDAAFWAELCGLGPASGAVLGGDVHLVRVSPCQLHLLIAVAPRAFVHAHAGLRRVVRHEGTPAWRVVDRWRLIEEETS